MPMSYAKHRRLNRNRAKHQAAISAGYAKLFNFYISRGFFIQP